MEKDTIKAILEEKAKDEQGISDEIGQIIKKYSDKWGGKEIEIDVSSEPTIYWDCADKTIIYSYTVKINIEL